MNGVAILGVAVDHHVEQAVATGILDLAVHVDELASAPGAAQADGAHLVGVDGIDVDTNGVVDDARIAYGVDVPVGAVGGAVLDGIGEQQALVGLHLVGGADGGVEHDGRVVVTSVEAEGGVLVLVEAGVGHEIGDLGLETLVEVAVVAAIASRERQERCYCKDDRSHCF